MLFALIYLLVRCEGAFIRFTRLSRAFGPGSEPGLPPVPAKQSGTLGTEPMEAGLRS